MQSVIGRGGFKPLILLVLCAAIAAGAAARAEEPGVLKLPDAAESKEAASTVQPLTIPTKPTRSGSYLAGQFAKSNGDITKAKQYLDNALVGDPKNRALMAQTFRMALISGNMKEASRLFSTLSDAAKKEALVDHFRLVEAIKAQDWDGAQSVLDHASKDGFAIVINPLLAAWVALKQGIITQPLDIQNTAGEPGNFAPFVYYQLALINDVAGFYEMAENYYSKSLENIDRLPYRVIEAFGNYYERQGATDKARELYDTYRESNPGSVIANESFMPPSGNTKIPRTVGGVKQGVAEIYFSFASLLLTEEFSSNSFIYLRLALELRPNFPAAQFMLATLLEQNKDHKQAEAMYRSIDPKSPFHKKGLLRLALALDDQGKLDQAFALLNSIEQQYPGTYDALLTKAEILRDHERYKEAVDAYSQVIAKVGTLEKYHWPIVYARGISYERMGKWESAEHDFRQALVLEPDQPDVMNYLGYSWLVMGRNVNEAKEMIEKAIAARPDDAHIVDSMGWALFTIGQYDEAMEYLERAISLAPQDPTVNEHLGDAYWRVGRKTEARYQWERALIFNPGTKVADAIKVKLEHGLPPAPAVSKAEGVGATKPKVVK